MTVDISREALEDAVRQATDSPLLLKPLVLVAHGLRDRVEELEAREKWLGEVWAGVPPWLDRPADWRVDK